METTLVILKPDCVQRNLMGKVITRFEERGLKIIGLKMIQITDELADKHYAEHVEKPFYPGLKAFMTSGPVVVMAVMGNKAIEVVRAMMGPTAGYKAPPGTIRGDFGTSLPFNLVHGSDGPEAAERELSIFFDEKEIQVYDKAINVWTVDMSSGKAE